MVTLQSFEDLECWKKSLEEANMIYDVMESCRDFGFRDQIQRATVSVMNNIAEGFGRFSTKDRIHFMNIAVGSLNEVRSMLYLGRDRKYISSEKFAEILAHNLTTLQTLRGFLRHLHMYKRHDFANQTNKNNEPHVNNEI